MSNMKKIVFYRWILCLLGFEVPEIGQMGSGPKSSLYANKGSSLESLQSATSLVHLVSGYLTSVFEFFVTYLGVYALYLGVYAHI